MAKKITIRANHRIISTVKASTEFEGLMPSSFAQKIGKRYLEGKISSDDAVRKIKAKYTPNLGR